jgi:hypothetical protein
MGIWSQRAVVGVIICAAAGLAGGCSEVDELAAGEPCATTLLGGQEICGEELVAFCKANYAPDVNGEVCETVLADAGIDPKSLVPQPPKRTRFGAAAQIEGADGELIEVTARRILNNIIGGEYEEPEIGNRYVGVEVEIANRGDAAISDYPSAKLKLNNGRQVDTTIMLGGECASDDFSSIDLAPGDSATGCLPFEIPEEADIDGFQMRIGSESFVARWKTTPNTTILGPE